MKYKKLGKSGIEVSEIGFGAWTIALNWWGKEIEEDEAKRMLRKLMIVELISLKLVTCMVEVKVKD